MIWFQRIIWFIFAMLISSRADAQGGKSGSHGAPEAVKAKIDLANAAYQMRLSGRIQEAEEFLVQSLAANPPGGSTAGRAQFELARIRFCTSLATAKKNGAGNEKPPALDLVPLEAAIAEAIKAEPNNPRYHFWSGIITVYSGMANVRGPLGIMGAVGQLRKSFGSFEKAVELRPAYHEARLMLVMLYQYTPMPLGGNKSKAEEHVKELEKRDVISGAKGRSILLGKDRKPEQIPLWKKIVEKYPRSAQAHEGLGEAYLTNGDAIHGAAEFREVLRFNPSRSAVLLRLAQHYRYVKEWDKAEENLRAYVDSQPAPIAPLRAQAMRILSDVVRQKRQG